jgi:hypothetical protein
LLRFTCEIGQLGVLGWRGRRGERYVHTAKKYALSPAPSLPESGRYLAYGGPHARVSSPRVGCSIFITSALGTVSRGAGGFEGWTTYPRSPRICVQYGYGKFSTFSLESKEESVLLQELLSYPALYIPSEGASYRLQRPRQTLCAVRCRSPSVCHWDLTLLVKLGGASEGMLMVP